MSEITVVTAFFDIGRGNLPYEKYGRILPSYQHRSVDTYMEYFSNLAKLKNEMIIYTTSDLVHRISELRNRNNLASKTKICVLDSYLPQNLEEFKQKIQVIQSREDYISKVVNPHLIEYWHADYVLVNIFKSLYVAHAIESDYVSNDLVAWIDFGYCRDSNTIPQPEEWKYDFDKTKMHFFNQRQIEPERSIDSIIYTGDVYIQGCHIVGGREPWLKLRETILKCLRLLIDNNLIDDDQTLLLMSYLSDPENCKLHYSDPNDWFTIFKKFNTALIKEKKQMEWEEDLSSDIRENSNFDNIDGAVREMGPEITDCNRNALTEYFSKIKNTAKSILEIGISRNGERSFTNIFLENKKDETIYVGIDIDYKKYLDNSEKNIFTIQGDSSLIDQNMEICRSFGIDKFDFIFIDGDHSINQVLKDWEYTRWLSDNGIVGFHDVTAHYGPMRFIKALDKTKWEVIENCCDDDCGIGFCWKK
jgi:protein YibB